MADQTDLDTAHTVSMTYAGETHRLAERGMLEPELGNDLGKLVRCVAIAGVECQRTSLPPVDPTHYFGVAVLSGIAVAVRSRAGSTRHIGPNGRIGQGSPPGRLG